MNLKWLEKIWIQLAILTALLLSKVLGQNYQYNDYGGDSYSYGDYQVPVYTDYGSQDNYNDQSQYDAGPNTIKCFTCHYHVKGGQPEGTPNCDDPFEETDVHIIDCAGPCGTKDDSAASNTINCYSCHYQIRSGYPEGMPGCDDPFTEDEIPIVECPGPCGKVRHGLTEGNPDDYLVTRNCIPGCKERKNDVNGNYQDCCTEPLCNGANGTVASVMSLTYMTAMLCLVISLFLWT